MSTGRRVIHTLATGLLLVACNVGQGSNSTDPTVSNGNSYNNTAPTTANTDVAPTLSQYPTSTVKPFSTLDLPEGQIYVSNVKLGEGGKVYLLSTDTGQIQELIDLPPEYASIALSPDAQRIAFSDYTHDAPDPSTQKRFVSVGIMDIDKSGLSYLTHDIADELAPEWSPDGKSVAFISNRLIGLDIYIVDIATGHLIPVTDDFQNNLAYSEYCLSWSQDGKRIAFSATDTLQQHQTSHIYVINIDGSNRVDLTPNLDVGRACPVWSPDGLRIAFSSNYDNKMYVVNDDGTNLVSFSYDNSSQMSYPIWSPDGKYIAFSSDKDGHGNIYVTDDSGHNFLQLTHNSFDTIPLLWLESK